MLDKLSGREPDGPPTPNPVAEKNWATGKNLVKGGDFQSGDGGVPNGWASRGGQNREPLGGLVRWTAEAGNPKNRVIRFTFGADVGDGFGVMYYSDPFPVEENALYRYRCRYRSNGPKTIVFIKCHGEMKSAYTPSAKSPRKNAKTSESTQSRECYRSQNNLKGPKKRLEHLHPRLHAQTHEIHPNLRPGDALWAISAREWSSSTILKSRQILPPPTGKNKSTGKDEKQRRHSLETGVTIKEMEENERKSREIKAKRKR